MAIPKLSAQTKGYAVANLVGIGVALFTKVIIGRYLEYGDGTIIYSEFVIVPLLMGIISAWFWRGEQLSTGNMIGRSCYSALIAIILSFLVLGEGTICLVIVSPLLITFIATGVAIGKAMFSFNNGKVNISVFAILLILFFADARSTHRYQNMVADKIVINAPVEKVWPYVVAYKRIKAPSKYWLFRIGMPSPVQSTATGNYVGAGRKCIFSNGYTFDEKITRYDVNRNLTFAITNQPRDPEIMGHIDILQGQFVLQDNGNGTTTLTGNSWYALHVFPIWYYDLWAESVTRNVHLRVMEHIKQLSEAK